MEPTGRQQNNSVVDEAAINFRPSSNFKYMKYYKGKGKGKGKGTSGLDEVPLPPPLPTQPPLPRGPPPPAVLPAKVKVEEEEYATGIKDAEEQDTERVMCRQFARGVCTRGEDCLYEHKIILSQLPGIYTFCRDFQNSTCSFPRCKFVHVTIFEKEYFYRTGYLPPLALQHLKESAGLAQVPPAPAQVPRAPAQLPPTPMQLPPAPHPPLPQGGQFEMLSSYSKPTPTSLMHPGADGAMAGPSAAALPPPAMTAAASACSQCDYRNIDELSAAVAAGVAAGAAARDPAVTRVRCSNCDVIMFRLIKMMQYVVQQPRTLESMALEELGDWIASQAEQMMSPITELQQQDAAGAEAALSRQIDDIRTHLERNLPRGFHDKLAEEAIHALDHLLEDTAESLSPGDCWESYSRMNVIGRMIETLFTKHLTSLTLDFRALNHIEMFLPTLLTKSNMLGGLIQLEIILNQTIDISLLLKDLHDLKHLSLGLFLYTAKALKCIAENCKLVEELQFIGDFKEETDVVILTHDMVVPLTQLPNLRSIDICGHVASTAIQALLLSCPNIEHFKISTYYSDETDDSEPKEDAIARALQGIMTSKQNAGKQFQLKTYKMHEDTTLEQLELVVQTCPLIESLCLTRWYRQETPIRSKVLGMVVNKLANLRVLELRCYCFHDSEVKDILQVSSASNLVELRLYEIAQIGLDVFIYISQVFPNLESLFIHSYIETYEYPFRDFCEDTRHLKIPPFRNLKRFEFYGYSKLRILEATRQLVFFVLLNCLNIEYLSVVRNILTDDMMSEVLDENPLICLKELRIENKFGTWVYDKKEELSMLVIDRIIRNCINPLVVLTELNQSES